MNTVYLGLGSNSSDRLEMIRRARILINVFMGRILKQSALYCTDPWGEIDQDIFINQVVSLETDQSPKQFHKHLLTVEKILSKKKTSKYGPRNIDIDILLFGDIVLDEVDLEIPHPRMHMRNFVLVPLAEIAPAAIHPVLNRSIKDLQVECIDTCSVELLESVAV